jgi:hypothetical protein
MVTLDDEQYNICKMLKGFGSRDAEIIKNIVIAYLSEKSYRLEKAALQQQKSRNDLGIEYLNHGLECKKLETEPRFHYIQLAFSGNCKKCGKRMEAGEWAYWGGRGSGVIICDDCEVRKFGTKAQAQMALRIKQQEYTLQALKKEIEKHIEEYKGQTWIEILENIKKTLAEIKQLNEKFSKEIGAMLSEDERKVAEEVRKMINQNEAFIEEARDFMMNPYKKRKKKHEVSVEHEQS